MSRDMKTYVVEPNKLRRDVLYEMIESLPFMAPHSFGDVDKFHDHWYESIVNKVSVYKQPYLVIFSCTSANVDNMIEQYTYFKTTKSRPPFWTIFLVNQGEDGLDAVKAVCRKKLKIRGVEVYHRATNSDRLMVHERAIKIKRLFFWNKDAGSLIGLKPILEKINDLYNQMAARSEIYEGGSVIDQRGVEKNLVERKRLIEGVWHTARPTYSTFGYGELIGEPVQAEA